jgi:hypothetical protein
MLGHLPRDHDEGEIVDMDYQPEVETKKMEVYVKPSYLKLLRKQNYEWIERESFFGYTKGY